VEEINFTLTCLQSFPINFRYSQDRIYNACSKYFEPGTSADTVTRCSHRQHRYTSHVNRTHAQYHSDLRGGKEAMSLNMPQFPTFGSIKLQAAGAHWHKQSSQCLQDRLYLDLLASVWTLDVKILPWSRGQRFGLEGFVCYNIIAISIVRSTAPTFSSKVSSTGRPEYSSTTTRAITVKFTSTYVKFIQCPLHQRLSKSVHLTELFKTIKLWTFWATVCKNASPYAIGPFSVCLSVRSLTLVYCIVAKRLDGSRCHLVGR